jgi:hypothetical protein
MVVWIVDTGVPPVATFPVDLIVAVRFLCWIRPAVWSAPSAMVVVVVLLASRPTRSLALLRIDLPDLSYADWTLAFAIRVVLVVLQPGCSFVAVNRPNRSFTHYCSL